MSITCAKLFDAPHPKPLQLSKRAWEVEKLSRMITAALDSKPAETYIWKPLAWAYIQRVQTYLPFIFTESRRNPYKHAELIIKTGNLANRLANKVHPSSNDIDLLVDIKTIYAHFFKIQVAATVKLTGIEELDRRIAVLVLAKRGDARSVATVQALYYAYNEVNTIKSLSLQLSINKLYGKQINENRKLFLNAVAAAITNYRQNNLFTHINPVHQLWPLLTHFSFKMLPFINKKAKAAIKIEKVLCEGAKLSSVSIDRLSLLKILPKPAKLLKLECTDKDFFRSRCALEKCINIEYLKISNTAWEIVPKPEKLKKLTLWLAAKPLSASFLKRLHSIESLKCCHGNKNASGIVYDLNLLPHLGNIKSLRLTHYHYTKELLAKLTSLRTLYLHLDTTPANIEALKWLNLLPNLKKLGLKISKKFFPSALYSLEPNSNIEIFQRGYSLDLEIEEIGLIKATFPNLKTLSTNVKGIIDRNITKTAFEKYGITLLFKRN